MTISWRKMIAWAVAGLVAIYLLSLIRVSRKQDPIVHPSGGVFAGAENCVSCHADITRNHQRTPHARTSANATTKTVKGSFESGHNLYRLNDRDRMEMVDTDSGLYQIGYSGDRRQGYSKIDIAVGSGTKGQTFLSWEGRKLMQLPASYYAPDDSWSSSPGNPVDRFAFGRPVTGGCLNCHTTHMTMIPKMNEPPDFVREQSILGITCERCHGPSMQHLVLQGKSQATASQQGTINPARLSRQAQLDLCAQCHGGTRTSRSAPFAFMPGDSLTKEMMAFHTLDTSGVEVHGNQYDLLAGSRCFLSSNMTCSNCHNPHQPERGNKALFSSRCLSCHEGREQSQTVCKLQLTEGDIIKSNCIDCHMPARASKKIQFRTDKRKELSAEIARTHFISIYPAESRKILEMMKKL